VLVVPAFVALMVTAPVAADTVSPVAATQQLQERVKDDLDGVARDSQTTDTREQRPRIVMSAHSDATGYRTPRWTPATCSAPFGCGNTSRENFYSFVRYAATSIVTHSRLYQSLTSRLPATARNLITHSGE